MISGDAVLRAVPDEPRDPSDDDAFFASFAAGEIEPSQFDHRAHLRAAACALERMPFLEACIAMRDGLRLLASRAGKPGLYHETQTVAAMALVAQCLDDDAAPRGSRVDVDGLVGRHAHLVDRASIVGRYREATWASDGARLRFRLPDAASPAAPDARR